MNRTLTKVALAAATALTISLAAPVSAHAQESGSATLSSAATSAPLVVTPNAVTRNPAATPSVTRLRVSKGTLRYNGSTYIPATVDYNVPDGWSSIPTARLTKGSRVSTVKLFSGTSVRIPSAWGAGVYRLDRITFEHYTDNTTYVAPKSVSFRVREGLDPRGGIRIERRGSKVTFKLKAIRSFNGSKHVALRKATVQVKKGKKWKTFKTVKLNKKGSKNFSVRKKSKSRYRLYVKTTATVEGGTTRSIRV